MTDKRILFGEFEFPRVNGVEYLLNEKQTTTDYLFVNEPHERFSMYFEEGFPIFKVPENCERPHCLFEMKYPGRMIRFFCPEKHANLDTAIWYFYVELLDELGVKHSLPGQVRVELCEFQSEFAKGKPKFIEVLESIRLNPQARLA